MRVVRLRKRNWLGRWWAMPLVGAILLLAGPVASPAAVSTTGDTADAELSRLRDFLTGPDRTFATRRDAADVLLEKGSPEARAVLLEVVTLPAPSEATRAVLDALASCDTAQPALVKPLFQLLASDDAEIRRAAAGAFSAYQGDETVLAGLKDVAAGAASGTDARLAAVDALAHLLDKRAIALLVELTTAPQQAVATAAANALAEMTGLAEMPPTAKAWTRWWDMHRAEPESRLLARLIKRFRESLKTQTTQLDEVRGRLIQQLTALYEAADAKEKGRLALEHLADSVPAVRVLAARQATRIAPAALAAGNGTGRKAYQDLVAALLKRVSDPAPPVRAAVAEALAAWREEAAGPVLLARLAKEEDPTARAALAGALGDLEVLAAIAPLVAMLDSPNQVEVLRAAGALGQIGDRSKGNADAVAAAVGPLGRLARSAGPAAVREAACLALAKIAPPPAEKILAAALEDPQPSVRYSAAQGIGNLGQAGDRTVAALVARLQDQDKGVRQAVAAALALVGGDEAAVQMADRLQPEAETEPAVRNALWDAIRTLAERGPSADRVAALGDVFFARGGPDKPIDMQRAAELYQVALSKVPAAERGSAQAVTLHEKLVDAYVAAGTPERAVPTLRQLIVLTPTDKAARLRELNRQLGLILLAKDPCTDSISPLASAMKGADPARRRTILEAIRARAQILLKAGNGVQALDVLTALKRALPDWGDPAAAPALEALRAEAAGVALKAVLPKLSGTEEQATAATATLKKVGPPAAAPLLDLLETAVKKGQAALESRTLAALEAATGRTDHGYNRDAPLADRLKRIADWRKTL